MTFRKFGTSDDQKIVEDEKDTQGLSKSAQKRVETLSREQILREVAQESKEVNE